jgi:hypothetical protein
MTTTIPPAGPHLDRPETQTWSGGGIEGPLAAGWRGGWREGTLTRAHELQVLTRWIGADAACEELDRADSEVLVGFVSSHLDAARAAARCKRVFRSPRTPSLLERASSNLDAAEALLLNFAPPKHVLALMPSQLNHVQRHLAATDPRRRYFERVADHLDVASDAVGGSSNGHLTDVDEQVTYLREHQGQIASIVRGASSAALREQLRVRSFRNVVVGTIVVMSFLAIAVAVFGFVSPSSVPLCFQPEREGQTMVVCPTEQSPLVPVTNEGGTSTDVDDVVNNTVAPHDVLVVEIIGLAAAAVAAAAAIRGIRGSSERYGLPVALTVLKLPTGAITAFLGLLLMRGQFVPGLSALDTSAQILAWALVFGYAQQLFTRFVDQQAHAVLDGVRRGTDDAEQTKAKAQR